MSKAVLHIFSIIYICIYSWGHISGGVEDCYAMCLTCFHIRTKVNQRLKWHSKQHPNQHPNSAPFFLAWVSLTAHAPHCWHLILLTSSTVHCFFYSDREAGRMLGNAVFLDLQDLIFWLHVAFQCFCMLFWRDVWIPATFANIMDESSTMPSVQGLPRIADPLIPRNLYVESNIC